MADLDPLLGKLRNLRAVVQATRAVNINMAAPREAAKSLVQVYFRDVRPGASRYLDKAKLGSVDDEMQSLNALANGRNAKKSYLAVLKRLITLAESAHFETVKAQSDDNAKRLASGEMTAVESRIYATLSKMLPTAAAAYRQAIVDLPTQRHSYRGPAIDLREALREVLDHMAPDDGVRNAPGFKLEPNTNGPTMAQKTRYIMKQRQISAAIATPAVDATGLVDTVSGRIVRAAYVSGSVSVHVSPTQAEVQQLKLHVDSALAQLLGIFT